MTTPIFGDGCGDCSTSYAVTGVLDEDNLSLEIQLPIDVATLAIQIAGTWAATLLFEATINGDDWFSADAQPLPAGTPLSSVVNNGVWQANVAGYSAFRVRTTSITGEADVAFRATVAGTGGGGSGGGGDTTTPLTWSRADFTLTGAADDILLSADADRRAVVLYNRAANDTVRYDLAGQSIDAGLDEGIPLYAGAGPHSLTGQDAPIGIITITGTAGNVVTVYAGVLA